MTGQSPFVTTGSGRMVPFLTFVLLASCTPALAQTDPLPLPHPPSPSEEGGTLQVSGHAMVPVPADQLRISFAVETAAPTAGEATSLNARQMEGVVTALRSSGVPGLEIETFGYNLNPEYELSRESPGSRTISGYRAQNNLRVILRELDAAGRILDAAVEAGANRISGLQFEASDTRQARLQALAEAVHQAREEAETIAEAMGVRLGVALEVNGGATAPAPRNDGPLLFRMAAAEATTPVEAGTLTVSASVSITYRIVERAP